MKQKHKSVKYRRFKLETQIQAFPSHLLCTLLLLTFIFLLSPVDPTVLSFCFFTGFLAIFTLLSNKSNYILISITKMMSDSG